ncbi:hypothetical protein [Lachnoclostridium phytofermentans]|uniref:hypothetical protein n=1 Tax=Lachnoclostridium phytofermentans TaxID=66219 RepID=UPI000496813D|nr:hypothetical protein [Lachnoclostridium phytofermentans]
MYFSQRDKVLSLFFSMKEAWDYLTYNVNLVLLTACKDAVSGIIDYLDNMNELTELNDLRTMQDMLKNMEKQNDIDINIIYNIKTLLLQCIEVISKKGRCLFGM